MAEADIAYVATAGAAGLALALSAGAARLLGLPAGSADLLGELGADRLFLDGLLSVWQPEKGGWGD